MTDFLEEKRREITERLKELKPLVEEFHRLEAAATALASTLGSAAADAGEAAVHHRRRRHHRRPGRRRAAAAAVAEREEAAAKAGPAKARARKAKATSKPAARRAKHGAGRRKGSGTRAAQALSLVQGQPGVTIPELAAKMGIATTYLYKVLPGLEREGKVRKQGGGWHATAS